MSGTAARHSRGLGDYINAAFVASSDGHGVTNIVDPPASAQAILALPHAA